MDDTSWVIKDALESYLLDTHSDIQQSIIFLRRATIPNEKRRLENKIKKLNNRVDAINNELDKIKP